MLQAFDGQHKTGNVLFPDAEGLLRMALSSPIRKLPQELVDEIVYCARASTRDDSPRAAFRLAHVCGQWRGDAHLWTRPSACG